MPQNPPSPPLTGLATSLNPVDDIIAKRTAINQTMSGGAASRPTTGPQMPVMGHQLSTKVPDDPQGMLAALKKAGYTGSRTEDINLSDEKWSMDELLRRAAAIR